MKNTPVITYQLAENEPDFEQAKVLFITYAKSLNFDLCFQNFDAELNEISRKYASLTGALFLAFSENLAIGCAGIRALEPGICELKRMYVNPDFRGQGIGFQLLKKSIEKAVELKYQKIRLDTVPAMKPAIRLYHEIGFYEIEPYCFNPIAGAVYMEKILKP